MPPQASYPQIVVDIESQLRAMKRTGIAVGTPIVQAVILAMFEEANTPSLTAHRFSDNWVRLFLRQQMKWSMWKTTRATAKIPNDWEIQCWQTHGCMAYQNQNAWDHGSDLVINYDHSGQHCTNG